MQWNVTHTYIEGHIKKDKNKQTYREIVLRRWRV